MRRIFKHKPPSNVSPDEQTPSGMIAEEMRFKASLVAASDPVQHARTQFDSLDKKKLRAALHDEQRSLCVYCESRVRRDKANPIEHWIPLSAFPHFALHWKNLYLSCDLEGTCDDSKADKRLVWSQADADLPWPTDAPYEDWIGFTSGGEAYVRSDAPLDEAKRRTLELALNEQSDGGRRRASILNLNKDTLREARKAAIDAEKKRMEREIPNRPPTESERHARATALLSETPYPSFVSTRVAYLQKLLGKNRR